MVIKSTRRNWVVEISNVYRKADVKHAATKLLAGSKIKKGSSVALLGSNYHMFKKFKVDPDCPKCGDSFELIGPKPVDIFTFEVSLAIREMLAKEGIPSKILIMPSDFMKGATSEELDLLRESYILPDVLSNLLNAYEVPKEDRIFLFESSFKARAQSILRKKVLRDRIVKFAIRENGSKQTIFAFPGHKLEFPIGSIVKKDGKDLPIPFCQVICSALYERIAKRGFTDMLGMFNDMEQSCVNQGTALAHILGFLRMNVRLSIFAENRSDSFSLIDMADYSKDEVAYPYSLLVKKRAK